jgi:hypothetical protein
MMWAPLSADTHRLKVMALRLSLNLDVDPRQAAINRAVIEILRNPVVARAVVRGLRLDMLEKV